MTTPRPHFSSPELMQMKNELKKIFEHLLQKELIPAIPQQELNKAIENLAPALLMLKKHSPEQFRQLTDEYKGILVFAFAKANNSPEFKLLKDQLMELVLTPQSELSKKPDLRLTLSKLKLSIDKLIKKLEAEKKMTPELALRFRKNYQDNAAELEKKLHEKKIDPRPIGGNPAFTRLFLDCLTLTLIDEFNFDPRTGMYRFTIDNITPKYGGYADPRRYGKGDALSTLDQPSPAQTAAQGAPVEEKKTSTIKPPWMKNKPTTPT